MKKSTSSVTPGGHDPKKEATVRSLVQVLQDAGYLVRREKLKQGPGFKVVSGACRAMNDNLIFVDRRLPQDEQISFLTSKITALQVAAKDEAIASLPETVRRQLLSAGPGEA